MAKAMSSEEARPAFDDVVTYDDLATRWSMNRDTVRRLARHGIVPGTRAKRWFTTWDIVLHVAEGRPSPLRGRALVKAMQRPHIVADVAKIIKRSPYTIREMLNAGVLPGWKLVVPAHLRPRAGDQVANRWFVDAAGLSAYIEQELNSALRRRFGADAPLCRTNARSRK